VISTTRSHKFEPPAPRPAATLVLLRDGRDGLEVLITIRPQHLRFMGGAAVFPGGAVDPGDRDDRWTKATNQPPGDAIQALEEPDPRAARAAFVCAFREAFEEVGYISGRGPIGSVERARAEDSTMLLEHLLGLGVVVDLAALVPAGRWVTPAASRVRFDTWFFLASVPSDWEPVPNPAEVDRCFWATPGAALEGLAAGDLVMAPPTIRMLQRLASLPHVSSALASARADPNHGVQGPLSIQIHPVVKLILAPNPGLMTGPGTNTYVIGDDAACVIDPAVDEPAYLDAIEDAASSIGCIVVTHRHGDHTGGVEQLVARTGAELHAFGSTLVEGMPVRAIDDGDKIDCGEDRLLCLHTPGHSADHICLKLGGVLFAGDTIVGEGTVVIAPPDGSLSDYLASLRRLRGLELNRIFPGHFRPLDRPNEVIADYLAHRAERHRAILGVLELGDASAREIVSEVYVDTPKDLHPIAEWTVLAHLEMAAEEGRVEKKGDRWHFFLPEKDQKFRK
jgi:glyoxylase-like metal-dependent hydrolase (beta-lactamase superfamily II)/8-oxo-dGTP pyrophosphatase MutT (NUDIX family)